jgi:uncharacterized protein YciI
LSPRFAYIYFMKDDPGRISAAVPSHVSYWRGLRLDGYVGGPFEDRSGGLIMFDTENEEDARRAVGSDPFVLGELLEADWLKRWVPE